MNVAGRAMSKVLRIAYSDLGQIDSAQVDSACRVLNKGGVVALPTDTIYGIAAKVNDTNALERIYKIKGRDKSKPLAVCVSHVDRIEEIADTSVLKSGILQMLMPGKLTLLFKRKQTLNPNLNPGTELVGVRVPDHNFIKAISDSVGPLALTSANRSGETSPLIVGEFEELWSELDCVYDAGLLQTLFRDDPRVRRLGSSVIDLSKKNEYRIVRAGCAINRAVSILKRSGFRDTTNRD